MVIDAGKLVLSIMITIRDEIAIHNNGLVNATVFVDLFGLSEVLGYVFVFVRTFEEDF